MFETVAPDVASSVDLSKIVLAIGSLGTAAYGLVDVTKGFGGGISNRGLGDIKKVVSTLIPASAVATLRANWLNGMAMTDQKSVAKALIKLNLTTNLAATVKDMANATGVDPTILGQVAAKLSSSPPLTPAGTPQPLTAVESDLFGRFDLSLSALLDQAYQRADQRYRNSAKIMAVFVSVALALAGAWTVYGDHARYGIAIITGLIATPLAPVAKDLSSAIQAGAKAAQAWKK
jgi:hypothetical protein